MVRRQHRCGLAQDQDSVAGTSKRRIRLSLRRITLANFHRTHGHALVQRHGATRLYYPHEPLSTYTVASLRTLC